MRLCEKFPQRNLWPRSERGESLEPCRGVLPVSVFELIDRFPGIRSGGRHSRQKKPLVEKYMQIICYENYF